MTATSPDLVAVPASSGKRVAALLIDIVGAALFGAVASALSHGNVAIVVTTIVEYVALQAILIALHGRSVGAFLARCALVRAGSSQLSPSLMVSAGYVILTALSSLIPPLPVIFVLLGGQRGSWMAKLFSLQCVTFVPEDTIDEAVAAPSPYGKAGAGIAEGHTSFSSVTDIPSAPISHSSESPASAQPRVELPQPSVELPKPSAPASSRAWPAPAPASSVPYVPGPQIPAPVQEVPAAAPVQEEAMPKAPATAPAPTPAWARETQAPKAPIGAPIPTPRPVQEKQAPKAPVAPPAPTARFSAPMPQPLAREASAEAPPAEVEAPRPPEPAVPTTALPTTAPKPAATATNSTTASAPASASYAALLLDTGQSIPVNRTIVLGRAPSPQRATDSPIPVEDQTRSLSRTHVRIAPSEGGITIEDLNSANGTRARSPNGQTHTLVPGQPIELPMNSQLLLGERLISVVDLRQRR
jgi:FHA domain containing protein